MHDPFNLYHQALAAQQRVEQAGFADTAAALGAIVKMLGLEAGMTATAAKPIGVGRAAPRARRDDGAKVTAA